MGRWATVAALFASMLLAVAQPQLARAANITVTTFTDEDNGSLGGGSGISLREAVLYSASGDVISLAAGTYNLTIAGGGEDLGKRGDLDIIGKSITISGAGAGATRIAINIQNTGVNTRDRVIDVLPGSTLSISGVTISGGITPASGGGIRNQGTLSASGIVVRNNFAVTVDPEVINGVNGGGIANFGTATIVNSEISGNSANRSGGGISNEATGTLTLDKTTIANNVTTRENGGGVANEGTLVVANSTFSGNSANRSGGGIYNNGTATVTNATITGNICNADARIGGDGGGAYNASATAGALTFKNSIIAGNQDLRNPNEEGFQAIFPDLNALTPNTIFGNSNNLIGSRAGINGSTTIGTPDQGDIVSASFGLAALASNGGVGQTHLPLPTSPAVDAANNPVCAAAPVSNLDQRSLVRPADGNGDASAICDIGSVEIRADLAVSDGATAIPSGGTLEFPSTPRGTPITKTITIANSGQARLVLNQASLSLPAGYSLASGFSDSTLDPGETTTLGIQLDASGDEPGAVTGPLSFSTNDPDTPQYQITLVGTVAPQPAFITLSQGDTALASNDLVSFGDTTVGVTVDRVFTITNTGDSNLVLGTITAPDGFVVQSGPSATTLGKGASTSFTVRLSAAAAGSYAGKLTIASNATNTNPFEVRLEGTVSGSNADQIEVIDLFTASEIVDGGSVNFGSTVVGTPLVRTFSIQNIGNADLTINENVSVPSGFSVVGPFAGGVLQPGQSLDLTIRANAAAAGTPSGAVSFGNSDADENPFNFTVSAEVTNQPAKIVVSEGSAPIADNSGSVSFGATTVGTPVVRTFTVRNTGGSTLTVGAPAVPPGYTLVSAPASTVAPGGTTTFQVRLNAAAAGSFSGAVSFSTNDATANPFNFAVSGTVNLPPPNITVSVGATAVISGSNVSLGTTTAGTPVSRTFTIKNTGGSTLRIDSINVPPGFTRNPDVVTADTLAPNASTTFVVVLDAATAGTYEGQVTVRTNDPDQAGFAFNVSGVVNPAPARIAVSDGGTAIADNTGSVSFGATTIGAPVVKTFTIRNTGGTSLTVGTPSVPAGYTLVSAPASTVAPGATTTFQVRLNATAQGTPGGTISFATGDSAANPFNFTVSGTVNLRRLYLPQLFR